MSDSVQPHRWQPTIKLMTGDFQAADWCLSRGCIGELPKPPASRALCQAKRASRAAFPSGCLAAQTKRWAQPHRQAFCLLCIAGGPWGAGLRVPLSSRPCVPSTCAGDLRELLRVPLRSQGYCGAGTRLSGPGGSVPDAPSCETFPDPSGLLFCPEILVVPGEKTPTGTAARGNP